MQKPLEDPWNCIADDGKPAPVSSNHCLHVPCHVADGYVAAVGGLKGRCSGCKLPERVSVGVVHGVLVAGVTGVKRVGAGGGGGHIRGWCVFALAIDMGVGWWVWTPWGAGVSLDDTMEVVNVVRARTQGGAGHVGGSCVVMPRPVGSAWALVGSHRWAWVCWWWCCVHGLVVERW